MNVSLTTELEKLVAEKVRSGLYHSASEVIREGLRLLIERDNLRKTRLQELRKEVQVGLDELDRGEGISGPEAFSELRDRISAQHDNQEDA